MIKELVGTKTKIRKVTIADAEAIIALRNDPKNNRFLSSQEALKVEDQIHWIQSQENLEDSINFSICDLENQVKGTISLYNKKEGKAEFGRFICTNSLLAIESEFLLLQFGFQHWGLEAIYCRTLKKNKKVWKQHTRYGFSLLGEDMDERIQETVMVQEITSSAFDAFDYGFIQKLLQRF